MKNRKAAELIQSLHQEATVLGAAIRPQKPLLDAYLYETHMRCGKSTCRCMNSKYRHSLWCLSYVTAGQSHTRTVPGGAVAEIRALCEQYRRLRACRKRLLTLAAEVAAAVDQHIDRHATTGWRRFEQLKADLRGRKTVRATPVDRRRRNP
jgi:hypothetical protein